MIWADKLALALLALVALILLVLGMGARTPSTEWWGAFFSIMGFLALHYALPFWIFLRVVDVLTGGPWRRRGRVRARIVD
jgi:hypothetical protein